MALSRASACRQLSRRRLSPAFSYSSRSISSNHSFLRISEEVREALHAKRPVVALETTIYTHGFPYPDNVSLASHLESIVRVNGGVPATIGILDGVARVGMDPEELITLASSAGKEDTLKISRRDLAYACGTRLAGKRFNGGTTIAGTMILAHLAGIKVFATGGLGGVHRGAESSMDISADLTELGRTPVTVISSGCKSFLDIPRTLEYLETEGVGVGTFADGRKGNVDFPAFWSRDSGVKSPMVIQSEIEAAAIIHAQHCLSVHSGLLFANPIPEEAQIPKAEMETYIAEAIRQANASGAAGKDNTPFVLAKIKELSRGKSVPANRALIEANVRRGTIVARELGVLEASQEKTEAGSGFTPYIPLVSSTESAAESKNSVYTEVDANKHMEASTPDVLVAGALAVDFSCDYAPFTGAPAEAVLSPQLQTSNPSIISQTLGGVAHNIAKASHMLGSSVRLCSAVGDDITGRAALAQLKIEGMRTDGIKVLDPSSGYRTAQYVAINDVRKDLVLAMADMSILESLNPSTIADIWTSNISTTPPKWLVVDGNWATPSLHAWMRAGVAAGANVAFEPVSVAKATRLFPPQSASSGTLPLYPHNVLSLMTPNAHELISLHSAASQHSYLGTPTHFRIIDALGIPSAGLRVPLATATSAALVDEGIPQRAIQLLPYAPAILTKLGPKGVLLTRLLPATHPALHEAAHERYVLARNVNGDAEANVGGLYVRLFEPEEVLGEGEVVSVNGVGDTFLGALVAGLVKGKRIEDVIAVAQRAAGRTLRSRDAVSPELSELKGEM